MNRLFNFLLGAHLLSLLATHASNVRLNQIQVIGTHNSYHLQANPSVLKLMRQSRGRSTAGLEYEHAPLKQQFSEYGIRQIELDLFADPKGGHYANPLGPKLAHDQGYPRVPNHDPNGRMREPGFKVLHVADFDYASTVLTFKEALTEIRNWSRNHSKHVPIMILLELKDRPTGPDYTQPIVFDRTLLLAMESEILSVFKRGQILTPDDVRGSSPTLRQAVTENGWPLLDAARGRVMFGLDNTDSKRELYLKGNPTLEERLLFVSAVDANHPAAAWFKINDPVSQWQRIQSLAQQGFMIRTRADSGTTAARNNDSSQREKAFTSGAHYISSDYPVPNLKLSPYRVAFPDGTVARPNPISARYLDLE